MNEMVLQTMLNIIRADLYRVFREKAVYITFGIFAGFISLFRIVELIGINVGFGIVNAESTILTNDFDGMIAPFAMMILMDFLVYFLLSVIIVVVSSDFSSNAVRNVLAGGVSRTKYYISKLITAIGFCVILACSSIIVPSVIGGIAIFKKSEIK
jgi:ABC-type transport system involved in multi-copper enzyme maturation permease subunit